PTFDARHDLKPLRFAGSEVPEAALQLDLAAVVAVLTPPAIDLDRATRPVLRKLRSHDAAAALAPAGAPDALHVHDRRVRGHQLRVRWQIQTGVDAIHS